MSIPVSHYGLHTSEDSVKYLHQGRAATNFIGLAGPSPFHVSTQKNTACPHFINAAAPIPDVEHWRRFSRLLPDDLVQAMLPTPKERNSLIPYVSDPNNQLEMLLVILSRMSSPIYPVVMPLRSKGKAQLLLELSITNVSPLVLTNVRTEDNDYMFELAKEARTLPRRLLFTGDPQVVVRAPLQRLTTTFFEADELNLAALPMESLGALLLRRYARSEPLNSPIVKGK